MTILAFTIRVNIHVIWIHLWINYKYFLACTVTVYVQAQVNVCSKSQLCIKNNFINVINIISRYTDTAVVQLQMKLNFRLCEDFFVAQQLAEE